MTVKRSGILLLTAMCAAMAGCGGGGNGGGGMGTPTLTVSAMTLQFGTSIGTPANPTPASLSVTTSGSASLAFTAASDAQWLSVTPGNGTTPGNLQVSVATGNLGVSSNTDHITITAPGAQGSPATVTVTFVVANPPSNSPYWLQWGRNPQHAGIAGQNVAHALADIVYDPFVTQEKAEIQGAFGESELTVHYQTPLTGGDDVYMMTKLRSYTPCVPAGNWAATNAHCGPNARESMIWCETPFTCMPNGKLVDVWDFASDWKPEPNGGGSDLAGREPLFHAVDANNFIYVPGAGGTIWTVNKADGSVASAVNPFSGGNITPADTYVAGPLSADAQGNIYYNVIELADPSAGNPWTHDIQGAWLVKVTPSDQSSSVSYAALFAGSGAPPGNATNCPGTFGAENPPPAPPWPPSTTAVPTTHVCGSQRPGLNIAPAISADGSKIYTASTAHLDAMQSYLVAVKSDLSGASWVAPLQNLLSDGCGFLVPIATPTNPNMPNACRVGSTPGVDPTTNANGSGLILDQASSSTTVLPDGSVLFGASTNYNGQRGHLFKFDATGAFVAAYDFGWDTTPTVYTHNGSYSVVLKDNHYPVPLYCNVSGPA